MALLEDPSTGAGSRFHPTLSVAVPSGWSVRESVTLVLDAATTVADPRQIQANVIASSEPVPAEMDTERYALAQEELFRTGEGFQNYRQLAFEEMRVFGGHPGFMRRFAWQPEGGPEVTQIQIYLVHRGRGYVATGTAVSADFREIERDLLGLIRSVSIEEVPAEGEGQTSSNK